MTDPISFTVSGSLLWRLAPWFWRWIRGRHLSPAQKLQAHKRWLDVFENHLTDLWIKKLREDVIIRDMRRIDQYPDSKPHKGISPWFRLGLLDTYHRGIRVGMGWYGLKLDAPHRRWYQVKESNTSPQWRYAGKDEESDETFLLVGFIPFANIEEVIWPGDEFYSFPHIYCHFDAKGKTPYERLTFCTKRQNPGGRPFYTEVSDQYEAWKFTRRAGVKTIYF